MLQAQTISREVFRQKRNNPSETKRRTSKISDDLAILLGLLYTDGCISPKQVNSYRIYFAVKSRTLADIFETAIKREFNLDKVLRSITRDGLYCRVVNSKEIGNYLVSRFGTFRTLKFKDGRLPDTRLPVDDLIKSKKVQLFLRAAFCGDGGISFYTAYRSGTRGGTKWLIRTVFLACEHPSLRKDYVQLLKNLGIMSRNVPGDGKIKIEDEVNIKKFHQMIGFFPGVEVTNSKYWVGFTKQEVLEILVGSYGQPSRVYNLAKFNR